MPINGTTAMDGLAAASSVPESERRAQMERPAPGSGK
jgi:hypothetical protein